VLVTIIFERDASCANATEWVKIRSVMRITRIFGIDDNVMFHFGLADTRCRREITCLIHNEYGIKWQGISIRNRTGQCC